MSRQITVIGELPFQIHKPHPPTFSKIKQEKAGLKLNVQKRSVSVFSDVAPSVGFWHVQSAKSMHQGTSNCGTATAVHFARALGYCMMLLSPIHASQLLHAFCRLRPSPGSCFMGKQKGALA